VGELVKLLRTEDASLAIALDPGYILILPLHLEIDSEASVSLTISIFLASLLHWWKEKNNSA